MRNTCWIMSFVLSLGVALAHAEPFSDCTQTYDYDLAIRGCTIIINQRPDLAAAAYIARGRAYHFKGNYSGAHANYTRATELDPRNHHAFAWRACNYVAAGHNDAAIADSNKAISLNARGELAYRCRGAAHLNKGNNDSAIRDFTKTIELTPSPNATDYLQRGLAYFQKGDYDRAIADTSIAIELNPISVDALLVRGLVHEQKREYDQAVTYYTRAIEIDPKRAGSYSSRGGVYLDKGNLDLAIADFSEALKITPNDAHTYLSRGQAYWKKGDTARSRADYQSVLSLSPVGDLHELAKRALARMGLDDRTVAPPAPPAIEQLRKKTPVWKASGTGVLVSVDGRILTNAHVVRECGQIQIGMAGSSISTTARLLATDLTNDLALLRANTPIAPRALPAFRRGARVGESIFAYGFPLAGFLPSSGNFTSGNITANAGLNDDTTKLQFSAPVQPGSSGGALLDRSGSIVGIVVATVDALKFASGTKVLPQNVNFAIKSSVVIDFLATHGVTVESTSASNTKHLAPEAVADRATDISVHIVCK